MNINFSKEVPKPAVHSTTLYIKKRGSLIELIIILIVCVLFYLFIVVPKSTETNTKKQQVEDLKQESAQLKDQQSKLTGLISQLENNTKEISKLDEALPLNPRTTMVYMLVENLVQSSGMTLSSLSISAVTDGVIAGDEAVIKSPFSAKRQLNKMSGNMGITGTFSQFQAFLKKMENSARILDIKTMEISSSTDELLDFRMSFDAYYYAP